MRLTALIFDVDGTLADTEEAHRNAFNLAFRQHDLDWNWSRPAYAHLLAIGGGKERLAAYINSLPLDAGALQAFTARISAIHATKTDIYTSMVATGTVALRDGIARVINDAICHGVTLAIASTTTMRNIEALLGSTLGPKALDLFSVIGAGDQVARKKPAPDIYEWVLRNLSVASDRCVAFEDSFNGLQSAKSAGLVTIVTPSYWTRTEDFSAADLVLPTLGSVERPLMPRAAALIDSPMLGLREIERQLCAVQHR